MKFKKILMGVTATVCTFSVIAPLNAYAEENVSANTNPEAIVNMSGVQQNIAKSSVVPPLLKKHYYLSHKDVTELKEMAGLYGTEWELIDAWAKKLGKSSDLINIMLRAVPALGVATIVACNQQNKGVVITKTTFGSKATFTCKAR